LLNLIISKLILFLAIAIHDAQPAPQPYGGGAAVSSVTDGMNNLDMGTYPPQKSDGLAFL
jgi:hypothetical protein